MIAPGERAPSPTVDPSTSFDADLASRPDAAPAPSGHQLLDEFVRYGRQRPFEEIVRRYAGMVFNVCYGVTKDKHDAEDATQAVFLTLAVQARQGTDIKALGPWLQQVAKRLSLDTRRGKKRRKTREERHHADEERRRSDVDVAALPSADLDELKTILHEELQKLPAKYRLPLILHYFGGMTREEMAAELKTKPSTLGVRIFRGREMLAGRLNGRGIHLPAGAVAIAIGYLVKRTVTDAMIASTSHAAIALANGSANFRTVGDLMAAHDGAATAARVAGIARRASHVLVIGKVRVVVSVALLAGTSLGAGVKALALLPPMVGVRDVQQMIADGVSRLVRPLLVEPLSRPLRSDATPAAPAQAVTVALVDAAALPVMPVPRRSAPPAWPATPVVVAAALPPVAVAPPPTVAPVVPARPDQPMAVATAAASPIAHAAPADAASPEAPASAGDAGSRRAVDPTSVRASPIPLITASADPSAATGSSGGGGIAGGGGVVAAAANDLYVPATGPATGASTATASATTSWGASVQIVRVPAAGGSVTESNGVVRGFGKVARTGTLDLSGQVVADGQGLDRTLDLTSFSAVRVTAPAGGSTAGWYAVNHGRLSLSTAASPGNVVAAAAAITASATTPSAAASTSASSAASTGATSEAPVASTTAVADSTLTTDLPLGLESAPTTAAIAALPVVKGTVVSWGTDAAAVTLAAVNSVRLGLPPNADGTTPAAPETLSLLATDRTDAPKPPAVDGATIGLWQVGPPAGPLAVVDIAVRYDDQLADALGGDDANVQLWTLGDPRVGAWEPVDPASFAVNPACHTVWGIGTDVGYFAVTVPALVARSDAMVATSTAIVAGASGVPEPSSVLAVVGMGVALLGRRRRRATEEFRPPL